MGLMHRESFPVNGVFCAQSRKFSPSKVLPYTVCIGDVVLVHDDAPRINWQLAVIEDVVRG